MKNLMRISLLLVLCITIFCCNKQELFNDSSTTETEALNTETIIPSARYEGEEEEVVRVRVKTEEEKKGEDGITDYCVYDIKTSEVVKDHPAVKDFEKGDNVCVDCPPEELCPGSNYSDIGTPNPYSPFVLLSETGEVLVRGTWRHNNWTGKCRRCTWGKKGYKLQ